MKKKFKIAVFLLLISSTAFLSAQETRIENNTEIPLTLDPEPKQKDAVTTTEDITDTNKSNTPKNLQMGLYITVLSDTGFLTRDIETGEKSGFEFDSQKLYSKGNWWFWGDLGKGRFLDAEFAIWDGTTELYQENSYAANVPDTTIVDGLQNLSSSLFAPLYGLNEEGNPVINKFAATYSTNYLNSKVGFGNLGSAGMSSYTGIYNTLEAWDDTGKGFVEFSNGNSFKQLSDNISLEMMLGLSRVKSSYGLYYLNKVTYSDLINTSVLFASTTSSEELFLYDESMDNAVSLFLEFTPINSFTISTHGIYSFTNSADDLLNNSAVAIKTDFVSRLYTNRLSLSISGEETKTVWGDDTELALDAIQLKLKQGFILGDLNLSLNNIATLNEYESGLDGELSVDNQLLITYSLETLLNRAWTTSIYTNATFTNDDYIPNPYEYGLNLTTDKLVLNYSFIDSDEYYNSISAQLQVTEHFKSTLASIIRVNKDDEDKTFVPFGLACGLSYQSQSKNMGYPEIFLNAVWAMDPYEADGMNLIEASNDNFTTYKLEDLYSDVTESKIRLGINWNL